ncbi:hypothetical protein GCM10022221_82270 [Actinocorallia aurea]
MNQSRSSTVRHLPTSPFKAPPPPPAPEVFSVGDRVSHDKHGLGTVISIGGTATVTVDFGTLQVCVPTPFPRLYKL